MGAFLVVAAVAILIWLLFRRSAGNAVAESALRSLQEADAMALAAWKKLDAAIDATADPNLTCARLVAGRRSELQPEILELWRYIDDLAERSNRRAEHYESVARRPAPVPSARAEGERVWTRIRSRAVLSDDPLAADTSRELLTAASDVGAGERSTAQPKVAAKTPRPDIVEAYESAKRTLAEHGYGRFEKIVSKEILRIAEEAKGLTAQALRLMAVMTSVQGGDADYESAMATLRDQEARFRGMREMGESDEARTLDPMIALYELFREALESWHREQKSRSARST